MQVHPLFSSFLCPSVPVRGDQTFVVLKVIFISIIKVLRLFCAVGYDFKDALDIIVSQNMVTITSILLQLFFFFIVRVSTYEISMESRTCCFGGNNSGTCTQFSSQINYEMRNNRGVVAMDLC